MGPGGREDLGRGAGCGWEADRRATHFILRRQSTGRVSRAQPAPSSRPRGLRSRRAPWGVAPRTAAASPPRGSPRPPRVRSPPGPPPPPLAPGPASAEGRPGPRSSRRAWPPDPELGLQGRSPPAPAAPRRPEAGVGPGREAELGSSRLLHPPPAPHPSPPTPHPSHSPFGAPNQLSHGAQSAPGGGRGRGRDGAGGMWPESRPRRGAGGVVFSPPASRLRASPLGRPLPQ